QKTIPWERRRTAAGPGLPAGTASPTEGSPTRSGRLLHLRSQQRRPRRLVLRISAGAGAGTANPAGKLCCVASQSGPHAFRLLHLKQCCMNCSMRGPGVLYNRGNFRTATDGGGNCNVDRRQSKVRTYPFRRFSVLFAAGLENVPSNFLSGTVMWNRRPLCGTTRRIAGMGSCGPMAEHNNSVARAVLIMNAFVAAGRDAELG